MEARRRSGESSSGSSKKGLRFAEEQLARHGWRRGQGLGKRENGISEALKVKVKCGTAGVGHNSAEQFTFHWWDHLFNASAANIAVEAGQDGVKVKQVSGQGSAITNQKPRKAQGAKNMLYGRFVKAATLTASGEEPLEPPSSSGSSSSSSSEEDEDEKLDLSTARRLTDEELVRACGGRTAHKGARHGLMMSAKLARLEEQEKAFLASRSRQEEEEELEQLASASEKGRLAGRRKEAQKQKQQQRHAEGGGLEAGLSEGARKKRKQQQQQQQQEELLGESAELPDPRTDRGSCGGKRRKQRKAE